MRAQEAGRARGQRRQTRTDVGASVDHAHFQLEDRGGLALRVVRGLRAVGGRRREAVLDAALDAHAVGLEEALGQGRVRPAAVEGLDLGEARHLDNDAIDGVDGRRVRVVPLPAHAPLDGFPRAEVEQAALLLQEGHARLRRVLDPHGAVLVLDGEEAQHGIVLLVPDADMGWVRARRSVWTGVWDRRVGE